MWRNSPFRDKKFFCIPTILIDQAKNLRRGQGFSRRRVTLAMATALAVCWFGASLPVDGAHAADDPLLFDPETGFRIGRYRTPTPREVPGGTRVNSTKMQILATDPEAILIDVMSAEGVGPDPIDGEWRVSKPRRHIPGSVWLPEVGRGVLDETMLRYFREQLVKLTGAQRDRSIVFYCVADCWMSWNAARRAAMWGYTRVFWYAEGTDGWSENDLPLAPATPVPVVVDE